LYHFCSKKEYTSSGAFYNGALTKSPRVISPQVGALQNATNIAENARHVKHKDARTRALYPPLGRAGFMWQTIAMPI